MDLIRKDLTRIGNFAIRFSSELSSSESSKDNIAIHKAVELIAYFHFDAKIETGSKFEVKMCKTVIDQMQNSDLSGRTLALCWIYFQAHIRLPLGQFIKVKNFHFCSKTS